MARDSEYMRQWRAANPEKVKAQRKRAYERAKARPTFAEQNRANVRRWREENPERARATKRASRLRNLDLERDRARLKKWREDNPEADRAIRFRARLKKYGLSESEYEALWVVQNGECPICGSALTEEAVGPQRVTIDHDHDSDAVRGLLHQNCNWKVGTVESLDLNRVMAYLGFGREGT